MSKLHNHAGGSHVHLDRDPKHNHGGLGTAYAITEADPPPAPSGLREIASRFIATMDAILPTGEWEQRLVALANEARAALAAPATEPATGLDVERLAQVRQSVRFVDRRTGQDVTTDDFAAAYAAAAQAPETVEP